ncbi:hypothetical protein GS506_22565 [Rhodococcus hoagii]|nr:hypothetical protein [Prescottella equi]
MPDIEYRLPQQPPTGHGTPRAAVPRPRRRRRAAVGACVGRRSRCTRWTLTAAS